MKIAIMQPYIFPYIGYFQLLNSVDEFVVYDNIEYTKKGWINRNRILTNGSDSVITFPLKKDSDYLFINQRYLTSDWILEQKKVLNKIKECYRKAQFFDIAFPIISRVITYENTNLFSYILNSLEVLNDLFEIKSKIVISSSIAIDHNLKGENKVIEICKSRNADTYINAIGGLDLYSKDTFKNKGIDLKFIKSNNLIYKQFQNEFVPWLSIIDIMMFNSKDEIKSMFEKVSFI